MNKNILSPTIMYKWINALKGKDTLMIFKMTQV